MKRFAFFALFVLAYAPFHRVSAAGIVRIANGDCAGFQAAVASAQLHGPGVNIVLSRKANYGYCPLAATGTVVIDGNGAALQVTPSPDVSSISVAAGARLTLRNLNLTPTPSTIPPQTNTSGSGCGWSLVPLSCPSIESAIFDNAGTLILDSATVSGVDLSYGLLFENDGDLVLRNSTFVNIVNGAGISLIPVGPTGTTIEIDHTTIANNTGGGYGLFYADIYPGKGVIRVSNSIVMSTNGPICYLPSGMGEFISDGGNVLGDNSCGTPAQNDRVVADAGLADFGTHGGVVGNMALNSNSPAIGNGLAANCEAADARGVARGSTTCDSGAYEFGGGQGRLGASGMSGLYYNQANNGHYVTVQRLTDSLALVIWNTFDEKGTPAWVYGVGTINGTTIQVPQAAENIGGILHPGGAVTGETPTLWGNMTLDISSCHAARLNYQSVLPLFGSGSVDLQRLVFVNGLDCSP